MLSRDKVRLGNFEGTKRVLEAVKAKGSDGTLRMTRHLRLLQGS